MDGWGRGIQKKIMKWKLSEKKIVEKRSEEKNSAQWIPLSGFTGKNNGFPFLDILGYLKNTHKNPKFGRVRQIPIRELGWEFPDWDLSHFAKFGIFVGIL